MIERILERPLELPSTGSSRPIVVEVTFRREIGGYTAEVRLSGERAGERLLHDAGPTCSALADATAVTIALALDERAAATEAPSPAPAPPQRFPVWAGATVGIGFGYVGAPSFAPGVEIGGDPLRDFPLRLGGVLVLPRDNSLPPGGVEVSLIAGELALCRALWRVTLVVRANVCADAQFGSLRGAGYGFPMTTASALPWIAVGGRLELEGASLSPFVWGFYGSLLAPTRRQTFSIESLGIAYDSSAVVGTIALRAGVVLW
jgi:hypothetical protein